MTTETTAADAQDRRGTPWQLGVACDRQGCRERFEGDFLVAEDSTRGERLRVVLDHVEKAEGWSVVRPDGSGDPAAALTFCPAHQFPLPTLETP